MKLNRSATTLAAAARILEVVSGRQNEELQISVSPKGELSAAPAGCGLRESEIIVEKRLVGDSFGEGWAEAEVGAVIEWIEENYIPADMVPEFQIRAFREEGGIGIGVETPAGNGRDFWADGSETDWQDNNGLKANEPEVLAAARAAAAAFAAAPAVASTSANHQTMKAIIYAQGNGLPQIGSLCYHQNTDTVFRVTGIESDIRTSPMGDCIEVDLAARGAASDTTDDEWEEIESSNYRVEIDETCAV